MQPTLGLAARLHPVRLNPHIRGGRRRPPSGLVGLAQRRRPLPRPHPPRAPLRPALRPVASSARAGGRGGRYRWGCCPGRRVGGGCRQGVRARIPSRRAARPARHTTGAAGAGAVGRAAVGGLHAGGAGGRRLRLGGAARVRARHRPACRVSPRRARRAGARAGRGPGRLPALVRQGRARAHVERRRGARAHLLPPCPDRCGAWPRAAGAGPAAARPRLVR
mmetsp:Transcript_26816/g.86601  ORF Transcript_26816/g.86601 Transcript_26816/m.86601 type:complete len:221 (+) Transcript_26816:531-1193(+)